MTTKAQIKAFKISNGKVHFSIYFYFIYFFTLGMR